MANLDTKVLIETVELEDNEHFFNPHETNPLRDPFSYLTVVAINHKQFPKNKYALFAYPGPAIASDQARVEHLPYHLHAKSPNIGEMKIDIEKLKPIGTEDDRKRVIPNNLRKHLEKNKAHYRNAIRQVYHTGKFDRNIKNYIPPVIQTKG